ncbi:MAG: V-type ATP synthase subunit E family protein [Oscillospiraceae bacterium]
MLEDTNKLNAFTASVLDAARAEALAIETETRAAEERELAQLDAAAALEAARLETLAAASAKAAADKRIIAARLAERRTVLEFRERCADEIFADVKRRLLEYCDSAEYPPALAALLKRAAAAVPGARDVSVYLRSRDMEYAPALSAAAPELCLEFLVGDIALGGLILLCPSAGRRVDLTFDSALADLYGRFSDISGFNVEERHD